MIRILAIGDSHIPRRASTIPNKICNVLNQLIERDGIDYTFFTGDVIKADNFLKFLKNNTKKKLFIVIGNMDYYGGNRDSPMYQKFDFLFQDNNKIALGLTHGHQISPRGDHIQLESLAFEKHYNILVSGHTHKEEVFLTDNGILLLNPGSITGAWSFISSGKPSFIILNLDDKTKEIEVTLFQLDIKSSKISKLQSHFIFENNRIRNR